jgi:DNA-binding LacI/PurR family transcriptional regulator
MILTMESDPPRRRPTLSQVAELAGISVPTVSKVLRGGTDVSPGTRMRVMEAVRETGYRRRGASQPAAALPQRPTMIDLVVNHVEGSWANSVLTGVEAAAASADIDVVISMAKGGRDWTSRLLRRPSSGAVVVLVDPSSTQFQTLAAAHVPLVLVDPMSKPPHDVPSVGVANWDGGQIAAEHLLTLGHRRFGVIAGSRPHLYSRARVDGFRSAVETHDADATVHVVHGDWDRSLAREEGRRLLQAHPDITAIFACSDIMALGVYDAAADLDLAIPHDVSVIGFDDVPEARAARPALTTVRQPTVEMGAAAVRMLLAAMTTSAGAFEAKATRLEMATELIIRDSGAAVGTTPAPA